MSYLLSLSHIYICIFGTTNAQDKRLPVVNNNKDSQGSVAAQEADDAVAATSPAVASSSKGTYCSFLSLSPNRNMFYHSRNAVDAVDDSKVAAVASEVANLNIDNK